MSLYPVIWAAEHAPVRDAEERAILMALVIKGDFDGCNCFRSYGTLAKVARVDSKTAGRRCREMEARGILRRQTGHLSRAYLAIPEEQRPVVWEVMIPVSFWSRVQLDEINEQREALARAPITAQTRPELPEAPPKKTRSDKGEKRPRKTAETPDPGTDSPHPPDYQSLGGPGTDSPRAPDSQSPPQGLVVPLPSESPSESPSLSGPAGTGPELPSSAESETAERETEASPKDDAEAARADVPEQRLTGDQDAETVVEAYVAAGSSVGVIVDRRDVERVRRDAAAVLAQHPTCSAKWLAQRAAEMPGKGWSDLRKHVAKRPQHPPQQTRQPRRHTEQCPKCLNSGWLEDDEGYPIGKCDCRRQRVSA